MAGERMVSARKDGKVERFRDCINTCNNTYGSIFFRIVYFYLQHNLCFDEHIMANSKYASTRETTNLARVAHIILGPCTDVLCALLTKEICPSTLAQKVKTYLCVLPKRKQPQITKEQETIIHNGNYSDFDITLLYFLLRNISNIPSHTKQWGNEPIPSDRSVSQTLKGFG